MADATLSVEARLQDNVSALLKKIEGGFKALGDKVKGMANQAKAAMAKFRDGIVVFAKPAGTPPESEMPSVARPEPALTSREST